ncbi:hypothetical protein GA0061070_10763 [Kosakonia oryziphila]|uniref:Uncharacterized protein n=1 Tax=Kosakonia oryziphila TaxID=1005667 RepID=A0A1C4GL32_9ENTR|nr:hypothetical protein GA0061070_10763 [Kosakonia oryziphila]
MSEPVETYILAKRLLGSDMFGLNAVVMWLPVSHLKGYCGV